MCVRYREKKQHIYIRNVSNIKRTMHTNNNNVKVKGEKKKLTVRVCMCVRVTLCLFQVPLSARLMCRFLSPSPSFFASSMKRSSYLRKQNKTKKKVNRSTEQTHQDAAGEKERKKKPVKGKRRCQTGLQRSGLCQRRERRRKKKENEKKAARQIKKKKRRRKKE